MTRADQGTRIALTVLGALILVGLVLSLLPNPVRAQLGEVKLENVDLVLFPASDPNARWTFKAANVTYNPETRESLATGLQDGKRFVTVKDAKTGLEKKELDLSLKAQEIRIDAQDNLSTQQANIFIPKGCYLLRLGKPGETPVMIDQNTGFRANYVDLDSPNLSFTGTEFTSDFALKNAGGLIEAKAAEKAIKSCATIKAAFQ